ncbi:hypothetical protein [Bacillus sp. SM2101]|uniref:hypothetical protein n=1 Tax=Bacillus sp. SM2101 TaxID=2805366 RepID=UPI001BDE547D|nr:hypothetical protein [Bacillus sp. SM2101]
MSLTTVFFISGNAVMFVRALGLNTSNRPDLGFSDISKDHIYYKEIAAVVDGGISPKS